MCKDDRESACDRSGQSLSTIRAGVRDGTHLRVGVSKSEGSSATEGGYPTRRGYRVNRGKIQLVHSERERSIASDGGDSERQIGDNNRQGR